VLSGCFQKREKLVAVERVCQLFDVRATWGFSKLFSCIIAKLRDRSNEFVGISCGCFGSGNVVHLNGDGFILHRYIVRIFWQVFSENERKALIDPLLSIAEFVFGCNKS